MVTKQDKTLFETLLESAEYKHLLEQLPDDERESVLAGLKKMVDDWENKILKPLENYRNK
jgi:hypothetical protein